MKIVILGAGFAGLAAVRELRSLADRLANVRITLLDRHPYTTMVPALPDLAAGRLRDTDLTGDVARLAGPAVRFACDPVRRVDLAGRTVITRSGRYSYDFLVIATGSVTNFFGFDQHREQIHTLDSLPGAVRIRDAFADHVRSREQPLAAVVGGGYTGMELACNLQCRARACGRGARVCVVERKDTILPAMPAGVQRYVASAAGRRGIELVTGVSVEAFNGRDARLSDGRAFHDVFLCWSTGTRAALADIDGMHETRRDGRIRVDACLRVPAHPEVFVAGDAAAVGYRNGYLRQGMTLGIQSGTQAGRNVRRAARGRAAEVFRPRDLGWVIPFCDTGVGRLLAGLPVRGKLPLLLHYFLCGSCNYNWRNRWAFWKCARTSLLSGRVS